LNIDITQVCPSAVPHYVSIPLINFNFFITGESINLVPEDYIFSCPLFGQSGFNILINYRMVFIFNNF
jgi:hypothetical protein